MPVDNVREKNLETGFPYGVKTSSSAGLPINNFELICASFT